MPGNRSTLSPVVGRAGVVADLSRAGLAARVPGGLLAAVVSLAVPRAHRLPCTLGRTGRPPLARTLERRWAAPARRSSRVRAELVAVPGARPLLPLDAPHEPARAIAGFVAAAPGHAP